LASVKNNVNEAMKHIFTGLALAFSLGLFSQGHFSFEATNQYHLVVNGDSLSLGWGGGFNQPQFSTIDLNFDGEDDLVAFDRSGNRIVPFLNITKNGVHSYRYAPQYVKNFPSVENWMLLADYNCDGKNDIFAYAPGGIGVYENTSANDTLSFAWALPLHNLRSDYGQGLTNLYIYSTDIPGIKDIDYDGDLDIFVFGQYNAVQWHENTTPCGLDYVLNTYCWGRFEEGNLNNKLTLDGCIGVKKTDYTPPTNNILAKGQHAGSTLLMVDLNGDTLNDALIGDVSYNNGVAAFNTGFLDSAHVSAQDTLFPSYNTPVDLYIFPAFFYEDVDFDGKKDLLAAPNMQGARNVNNVLRYKNTGTTANPNFNYQDSAFLQRDMIDMGEGAMPVLVDIDFDGLLDLFVGNYGQYLYSGNYTSYISYYKNTGTQANPKFTLQQKDLANISQLGIGLNLIPAFGDLDGDVDIDMLVGSDDGTLYYFENTGGITTPAFTYVSSNYQGIDVGNASAPQLFDLDEDGDLDLIIGEETGNINYYENSGSNPPVFTLVTESLGGVDVRGLNYNSGYSVPNFYRKNDTLTLFVGSQERGILQFDSVEAVMALPPQIEQIVGTGTLAPAGSNLTPFGTSKRNGRNQMLYKASELKALGFKYGKIISLSFEIANTPSNIVSQGFSIKMKSVKADSLTQWETGLNEVYNYLYPFTAGWNDITLTTPFLWDGESDLVIEVCFSKNFQSNDIPVRSTDVGFASNAYGDVAIWNGNTQDGCAMPYLATSKIRPNIRLKVIPTFLATDVVARDGFRNAPAVGDLNGDQYPDMIMGNYCGGMTFYAGVEYVAPPIGVEEHDFAKRNELLVYPNPSRGIINVVLPEEMDLKNATLQVFDLTGRMVKSVSPSDINVELDLSAYTSGLYILVATDGKLSFHNRIVVQR